MKSERKEKLNITRRSYRFIIARPGGNDTCLIFGDVPVFDERKRLNDFVMQNYPSVEQVGFVNPDIRQPQLAMAGGEFCGNATRSTAWQYLEGRTGSLDLKVSGASGKLTAGVDKKGEAFAQMPIYSDPEKIKEDKTTPGNFIVEMEGITQYIDTTTPTLGLSPEQIKSMGMDILKKKGLTDGPAAGVMFTRKNGENIFIDPVVYVKAIDTLFYETACGSGTTAVGLVLAKSQGKSVQEVPVYQPSGLPIKISITYDGSKFSYAEIRGPITKLASGSIEKTKDGLFLLQRITNRAQLGTLLKSGELSNLYNLVFGGPPYYESFSSQEVTEIFQEYVTKGLLFIMNNEEQLVGFGAALPLTSQKELTVLLKGKLNPVNCFYMADLGVDPEYRNQGLAKSLVEARLQAMPPGTTVVMRTSEFNIASQTLYKSLGFTQIPDVYQEVEQTRIDGNVQTDKRVFFVKKI